MNFDSINVSQSISYILCDMYAVYASNYASNIKQMQALIRLF